MEKSIKEKIKDGEIDLLKCDGWNIEVSNGGNIINGIIAVEGFRIYMLSNSKDINGNNAKNKRGFCYSWEIFPSDIELSLNSLETTLLTPPASQPMMGGLETIAPEAVGTCQSVSDNEEMCLTYIGECATTNDKLKFRAKYLTKYEDKTKMPYQEGDYVLVHTMPNSKGEVIYYALKLNVVYEGEIDGLAEFKEEFFDELVAEGRIEYID